MGSYLLGEQAHVVAQRAQPLEQGQGLVPTTDQHQVVAPARTWSAGRRPRLAGRPSTAPSSTGAVALHEAVDQQLALDRLDRADDRAGSLGGRNPTRGRMSRLASSSVGAVGLHEALLAPRSSPRDTPVRGCGRGCAPHRSSGQRGPLHVSAMLDGAVEGDPGHDLGVGEVPARTAHLPDAVVGLLPDLLEVLHHRRQQIAAAARGHRPVCMPRRAGLHRGAAGVEHLAEDVELELLGWPRCRCAPASSPRSPAASRAPSR